MTAPVSGSTRKDASSGRARGIAAAISGGFAVAWFGWGMAALNPSLPTQLFRIGQGLAVLVATLGVVLAVRSPAESTPMRDPAIARRYGTLVSLEFALIGVGNVVLVTTGFGEWMPVWVCASVGVHFIPLSRVFKEKSLMVLGLLITAVAVIALAVGLTSTIAPGTITGAGAGLCLLGSAAITLIAKRFYTSSGVAVQVQAS